MDDVGELLALMIFVGHRSRVVLEEFCATCDGRVACELLLLRALGQRGQRTKRRDLARDLGWSPTRVSQVVDRLVGKDLVHRMRGHRLTEAGVEEAAFARELLHALEETMLEGVSADERQALLDTLRRVAATLERPSLT